MIKPSVVQQPWSFDLHQPP